MSNLSAIHLVGRTELGELAQRLLSAAFDLRCLSEAQPDFPERLDSISQDVKFIAMRVRALGRTLHTPSLSDARRPQGLNHS